MTTDPHLDELVERACRAWWDAEKDGKRIATRGWDEVAVTNPEWLDDYRMRMRAAIIAIGV